MPKVPTPKKLTTERSVQKCLRLYPWQQTDWQQLLQYQNTQKIPHALLLTGSKGLAKFELAMLWAKALLCETLVTQESLSSESLACGHCTECDLFSANTHPDFMLIEPEEEGKAIKVAQIRELVEFVSLTKSRGNRRVIIISPAESMNMNAANSLLKTLEEPPENTIILLVSSQPYSLPATIRSRCQHFPVSSADTATVQLWLAEKGQYSQQEVDLALSLAENTPLNAQFYLDLSILNIGESLLNDWLMLASGTAKPTTITEKWLKQPENVPIRLVYTWLVDMIRYQSINDSQNKTGNKDIRPLFYHNGSTELQKLAFSIPVKRLFVMYDKVIEILKLGHTSLNKQLQLESLLIQWSLIAQRK